MQHQVTTDRTSPLDGSMRELAALALSEDWNMEAAIATGIDPIATLAFYEMSMVPVADADPDFTSDPTQLARKWIKPIGMKISPTMSTEQCSAWLTAVMMALSDFPAKVIMQAARNAIRVPMNFMNEVDGHIRVEAEKLMRKHRDAMYRLKCMQREIIRASQPKLDAPEGWEDGKQAPMTLDELRATARSAIGKTLMSMGLAGGFISQEDHDLVLAEIAAECAES